MELLYMYKMFFLYIREYCFHIYINSFVYGNRKVFHICENKVFAHTQEINVLGEKKKSFVYREKTFPPLIKQFLLSQMALFGCNCDRKEGIVTNNCHETGFK